jgi:hypothetical protein
MGRFKDLLGGPIGEDPKLLQHGLAGTAVVQAATNTGIGTNENADQPIYELRLRVSIPGREEYEAEHRQWTFGSAPPAVGDVVSVKVDPKQAERLVVDWRNPPTGTVTGGASRADILAEGVPGTATVLELFETGVVAPDNGDPVLGFVLDVRAEGREKYELRVGQRVPAAIAASVTTGATYPVKVLVSDPSELVIDWEASGLGPASG